MAKGFISFSSPHCLPEKSMTPLSCRTTNNQNSVSMTAPTEHTSARQVQAQAVVALGWHHHGTTST